MIIYYPQLLRPICIELDPSTQKFSIFNKGKVVSKNNVIKMKFPSEVYDLNNSLEQNVRKTLKNSNLRLIF